MFFEMHSDLSLIKIACQVEVTTGGGELLGMVNERPITWDIDIAVI
jgi:hypothetical protein